MTWTRRLALFAALVAVVSACSRPSSGVGADAHDVAGPQVPVDGVLVSAGWRDVAAWVAAEADAGHPVVLNFFASWCEPCRDEMPLLLEAADAHPLVSFAGVDHLDFRDDGQRFIDDLGVHFPTFHDLEGHTATWVAGRGMPVTAFFDAAGVLVHTTSGPVTATILDEQLARLEAGVDDE